MKIAAWIVAIAVIMICIGFFVNGLMRMVSDREHGAKTKRELIIPIVTMLLTIAVTGIMTR